MLARLHIKPHLGNVRLDRVHAETIEHWLADLERMGVGLRTRQSALLRLRTALTVAVQRRRLGANPAEHVEPPKGVKPARRPAPSLEDARRLLAALAGDPLMKAFALLWLGEGLRRGETLGLRWDDIHFDEGYLLVQRRVNRVQRRGLVSARGPNRTKGTEPSHLPGS